MFPGSSLREMTSMTWLKLVKHKTKATSWYKGHPPQIYSGYVMDVYQPCSLSRFVAETVTPNRERQSQYQTNRTKDMSVSQKATGTPK